MAKKKQYTVAGIIFEKQADLEAAVKMALNSHPKDVEFVDNFLASVINELHEEVIKAGQKATGRFIHLSAKEQERRKMTTLGRWRGGSLLMAYFKPLNEWRDVTVYPWRNPKDPRKEIKRALREFINPYLPKPTENDFCSVPGCSAKGLELEYEHLKPTFDEIAEECLEFISVDELNSLFGYDKFKPGTYTLADFIPHEHPAVKHLFERHKNNKWVWLCAYHHRNVRKAKRG